MFGAENFAKIDLGKLLYTPNAILEICKNVKFQVKNGPNLTKIAGLSINYDFVRGSWSNIEKQSIFEIFPNLSTWTG